MLRQNQSVMECRRVDTWLRDRLRRVVGGRSRVLGRNPLSLLVLRPGPSQDLSRRAGIEGPGRMSEPSAQSGSQDLSRRAGIEGRRPRAAAFSTWAWSQDLSRWAGIEGARDTPPVRPYMSQDLSRPAGEYPEILELRIDGMWGISRVAGIEGTRAHCAARARLRCRKTYPAGRELREDVAVGVHARTTYPAELELRIDGMWAYPEFGN